MEELTRLQTSRRAYRSHVTRIFNKVEEALAKEIDELGVTYLKTAVTQLEKKREQIVKLDQQILDRLQDPTDLEDAIMDSEELQDSISEKINELNTCLELLQLPPPPPTPWQESGGDIIAQESDHENVSDVITTLPPISLCDAPVTSGIIDTPVICTAHDALVTNVTNDTPVVCGNPGAPSTIVSNPSLTPPILGSISTSPVSLTSVSYFHGSGPPPLIPRVTNTAIPNPLSLTGDTSQLVQSLSTLNLGISNSPSLAGIPTINTIASTPPL